MIKSIIRFFKRSRMSRAPNLKVLFFPRDDPTYSGRTEAKSIREAKRIITLYKELEHPSVRPPEVWPNTLKGIRILGKKGADYLVYKENKFLPRHRY